MPHLNQTHLPHFLTKEDIYKKNESQDGGRQEHFRSYFTASFLSDLGKAIQERCDSSCELYSVVT